MSTAENSTSSPLTDQPNPGTEFLDTTRIQALGVLTRNHGGLVAAIGAPLRNFVDWVTNQDVNPANASNVINARNRFNNAANEATFGQESGSPLKEEASLPKAA